ncbi:MAG: CBS domain-containing protein [Candidatus Marinimicrobia bacterium]|nr:CBS domain-containing protein [Candidatus Neomarinimicrobiota bacterium]
MEYVKRVEDLMVALDDYATVNCNESLEKAVEALEVAQDKFQHSKSPYLHRAILVIDDNNRVVGKISQLDVLRALEDSYDMVGDMKSLSRFGLSPQFVRNMMSDAKLWFWPFDELCKKGAKKKVKDFMYTPSVAEYVCKGDSLSNAIHLFIVGHHQSLLVTDSNKKIVGVLRLADVFHEVQEKMKKK